MEKIRFCAVICEYNPFHNGHKYQLDEIRRLSGCEKILCVMSGNFTQRGEAAIFDKFTRARHAVAGGADAVLELPASFAVAPAEPFASGAVAILSSIPAVTTLAFGCESGSSDDFMAAARATLSEDKQFKELLKKSLKEGNSYAKARTQTVLALNEDVDEALFTAPNNVLGTEYCRAILRNGGRITPLAIPRTGAGYLENAPRSNFSSATALRACMNDLTRKAKKILKANLPAATYADAISYTPFPFEEAALCALVSADIRALARTPDCTEGLENKLKALSASNATLKEVLEKTVSKRYTLSRIKRIVTANFLGLREEDTRDFLTAPLYYNLLAVKKEGAEQILSALGEGKFPLLARKSDAVALKKEARDCYEVDVRANRLYAALTGTHTNDYQTLFV